MLSSLWTYRADEARLAALEGLARQITLHVDPTSEAARRLSDDLANDADILAYRWIDEQVEVLLPDVGAAVWFKLKYV